MVFSKWSLKKSPPPQKKKKRRCFSKNGIHVKQQVANMFLNITVYNSSFQNGIHTNKHPKENQKIYHPTRLRRGKKIISIWWKIITCFACCQLTNCANLKFKEKHFKWPRVFRNYQAILKHRMFQIKGKTEVPGTKVVKLSVSYMNSSPHDQLRQGRTFGFFRDDSQDWPRNR